MLSDSYPNMSNTGYLTLTAIITLLALLRMIRTPLIFSFTRT